MGRLSEKLDYITILYGLAVILVIFGHSHPLHVEYPIFLEKIIGFIYLFHMPLFFFISGILVVYTDSNRNIYEWWMKKAGKLMFPYIFLTILAWGPKTILGSYMKDNMEVSISNFIRIIFIPRENVWGHFWYIPVYLILMLLAASAWKYHKNRPNKIFLGGG